MTAHPTAEWIGQQIVEASHSVGSAYRSLPSPRPGSVRQLRHSRQQESLDVAARLHVTQANEGIDQGIHLEARDLAGAIKEIVFVEEVVGLLDVLYLLAADRTRMRTTSARFLAS